MKTEEIVRRQLVSRLTRLKAKAAALAAEIAMVEGYLADAEKMTVLPRLKLRKNSAAKWSIQGQVRRMLGETSSPVRAQHIFDALRKYDPGLKSSTFRSHIRRMVDAGIIRREGSRGHYQLTARPLDEPREREVAPQRVRRDVYKLYI